ncbi:uncharacterized protein NPIL_567071 [Nephila pilipes]|uniref:Uncharacterized protein n=1 Tax=Nephila pilipes TaxID=299642 RepID=A0A8X6P1C3_NEPPI|nr:uncharacterized protein NPIL_567071 [Nephila pilipes]
MDLPRHKYRDWNEHAIYNLGASTSRMVTRSQGGFNTIKNTKSDLEIFANAERHEVPKLPPLMVVMKGGLGAIPNTYITRSFDKYLTVDTKLCKDLESYKKFKPSKKPNYSDIKKQRRKRSKK